VIIQLYQVTFNELMMVSAKPTLLVVIL